MSVEKNKSFLQEICDMLKSLFFNNVEQTQPSFNNSNLFKENAIKNNQTSNNTKTTTFNQDFGLIEFQTDKLDNYKIKNGIEHQKIIKTLTKNSKTSKSHEDILKIINVNVFYLEKLSKAMSKSIYVIEYEKVNQLLEQSKNCLKLLKNINQNQIFYQNTTNFVLSHAMQISKLTEHLKHVNLD